MVYGILIGLVISVLIFTIMCFFRAGIEKKIKIIETQISSIGPKPKGFLFEAEDDVDVNREEIIKRNKKAGVDTKLSDLIDL